MKFYSEFLDEFFDSEKDCIEAELDRKREQKEAEERRKREAERRKFKEEKAIALANLEKKVQAFNKETEEKVQALNKEVIEYARTYENENPWLTNLIEAILEQPSEKKTKEEKRPAATPITRNEFEKILEGFLN